MEGRFRMFCYHAPDGESPDHEAQDGGEESWNFLALFKDEAPEPDSADKKLTDDQITELTAAVKIFLQNNPNPDPEPSSLPVATTTTATSSGNRNVFTRHK